MKSLTTKSTQRGAIKIGTAIVLAIALSAAAGGCAAQTSAPPSAVRSEAPPTAPQTDKTDSAEQCKALSNVVLGVAAVANGDPTATSELASLRALEKSGPPEIRSDVTVITDFLGSAVTAIQHNRKSELKETPALRKALQHEAEWTEKNCPTL